MSNIVRRQTNTATGAHWLRRTMATASRLAKNAKWFGVQDGYLLWAKRVGKQRTASVLDMPPHVRVVGNTGVVPGQLLGSPRVKVGGNRDAFHPGIGADPTLVTVEDLDGAQFPTSFSTINLGATPAVFGLWRASALPEVKGVTKLWYGGPSDSAAQVEVYPLSAARPLYTRVEFLGRGDTGTAINTPESFVTSITGGYVMSPRDIVDTAFQLAYPAVTPHAATDYDPIAGTIVAATPVTKSLAKIAADTGQDYGSVAVFFTRSVDVGTEESGTSLYLFQFPNLAAFQQTLWRGEEERGYTPTTVDSQAVLHPDGSTTIYGRFYGFVYGTTAPAAADFEQMLTRFMLSITPEGLASWAVLSCDVSGSDASLAARRIGSAAGQFRWVETPTVFYGGGSPWAFWPQYNIPSDGLAYSPSYRGGYSIPTDFAIVINRGAVEAARGRPANITLFRFPALPTVLLTDATWTTRGFSYVACHVDTGGVFGVSFFGWDITTEELKLCKWDTVDGFGIWEVDLAQMNLRRSDRLPSISVYQRCSVVDGLVVGLPSFVANSEYAGGNAEGHIIARGVAKSMGLVTGLSVSALGNPLQTTPPNNLYGG
jgi:hypothetical protein